MGIDIYARWYRMTKAEQKAQYTGFDSTAGSVGYLREAYHGGPYATRVLVAESFDAKRNTAAIPAATLRTRLPLVATLVLIRAAEVYHEADARQFLAESVGHETALHAAPQESADLADLPALLMRVFTHEVPSARGPERTDVPALTPKQLQAAAARFPTVRSFVAFVELCEQKERVTGRPVKILASY